MEIVSSLGNVTAELDQFLFFYPSCDFFSFSGVGVW